MIISSIFLYQGCVLQFDSIFGFFFPASVDTFSSLNSVFLSDQGTNSSLNNTLDFKVNRSDKCVKIYLTTYNYLKKKYSLIW